MFVLHAEKTKLTVQQNEPVIGGSVNVYRVRFSFSPDWDGLTKTAYFRSGTQIIPVLLGKSCECMIPWEVTDSDDHGKMLFAGICGTLNGRVVLPTIEANLGIILQGVPTWPSSQPPTPSLYEQILAVLMKKQDKIYGLPGQVIGFNEAGEAEAQDMPERVGGITDHSALTSRDAEDQHPIKAITGLEPALQQIPKPMTAAELQNILYGGKENA